MRHLSKWIVLVGLLLSLTGCLAVVKMGKPDPKQGPLVLSYGTPATKPAPPATGPNCGPFIPPQIPATPMMRDFSESDLDDAEYVAEVLALHNESLRKHADRVTELWNDAYTKYRQSCNPPQAIPTS